MRKQPAIEAVLVTANHIFPIGRRRYARVPRLALKALGSLVIKRQIARIFKQAPNAHWRGLISKAVSENLPGSVRTGLCQYQDILPGVIHQTDYTPLHNFADQLEAFAQVAGEKSGLAWRGSSVFKISEPRWAFQILANYIVYVEAFRDLTHEEPDLEYFTFSRNSVPELIFQRMLPRKEIKVPGEDSLESKLLELIQGLDASPKIDYDYMLKDWLTFTPTEPKRQDVHAKEKPRLLFVAYKERTLRRLEALLETFGQTLDAEFIVATDFVGKDLERDTLLGRLENRGVKIVAASGFISREETKRIVREVSAKIKGVLPVFRTAAFSLQYKGVELAPLVQPFLEEMISEASPVTALHAETSKRCIDHFSPDLIVHFEEWDINRAFTLEAERKGIPTVSYSFLSPSPFIGLVRRLSRHFGTSGSFLATGFVNERACKPDQIEVVGDPLVDKVSKLNRQVQKDALVAHYNFDKEAPIFLILATYPDEWYSARDLDAFYRSSLAAAAALNAEVLVKAHPQQDPVALEKQIARLVSRMPKIIHSADLIELASGCDLVIVPFSSATSQLILSQTPIVSIQPRHVQAELEKQTHYASEAGIPVAGPEDNLVDLFQEMLSGGERCQRQIRMSLNYVTQHTGPLDGKSAERIARHLERKLRP
ncbi:MAG: hypothetical protein AB1540_00865 [Bdellovibrionota bacterium]